MLKDFHYWVINWLLAPGCRRRARPQAQGLTWNVGAGGGYLVPGARAPTVGFSDLGGSWFPASDLFICLRTQGPGPASAGASGPSRPGSSRLLVQMGRSEPPGTLDWKDHRTHLAAETCVCRRVFDAAPPLLDAGMRGAGRGLGCGCMCRVQGSHSGWLGKEDFGTGA